MDQTSIASNRQEKQNWINLFSSIKNFNKLPNNNLTITTKSKIRCLATEFANKLIQKRGGTVVLRGKRDVLNCYQPLYVSTSQPVEGNIALIDIEIPVGDILRVSDDVDIVRFKCRATPTQSKENDMKKSCCKWFISNIAEYLSFDDCVTEIEIQTMSFPCLGDIFRKVKKDIRLRLKTVKGIDSEAITNDLDSDLLKQLKSITCTETGSRLVLDALLVPLCSALDVQFEVNKSINCTFLPKCTFDYCIRKGEHIIGCIEAKSVKGLSSKSIAQAVLQLMILQTTLIATEAQTFDISEFLVFAIVTDGHRFIYMQLKGSSLGFEHDGDKVRIMEVRREGDFKDILQHIRFLVDGAVGHLV